MKLLKILIIDLVFSWVITVNIYANPENGVVGSGKVSIAQIEPNKLDITQYTERAIINWESFNLGIDDHTNFNQPSPDSIILNRIHSHEITTINGKLTANGKVIIVNQNGIVFGNTAKVDVNSLVATSSSISNAQFMDLKVAAARLRFNQPGSKDSIIVNAGQINARSGLVGLVAPNVVNSGLIIAKVGKVALSSGDRFTLDLYGDRLLDLSISEQVKSQIVANSGQILADGGEVILASAAGRHIVNSLVLNEGELRAKSIEKKNGKIIIRAAGSNAVKGNVAKLKGKRSGNSKVLINGILDVSGLEVGERGGKIEVTADQIGLLERTFIDASGHSGKAKIKDDGVRSGKRPKAAGGEILIGGDYLGKGKVPTAKELYVDPGAVILNDAIAAGDAGRNIFWSDGETSFYGKVFARALGGQGVDLASGGDAVTGGNKGSGGFVETSGKQKLAVGGEVNLTASNGRIGEYLLDPSTINIYGNFTPKFQSTDQTINLQPNLKAWIDFSNVNLVQLIYQNVQTGTGSSASNISISVSVESESVITTSSPGVYNAVIAGYILVGARIRLVDVNTVTTTGNLYMANIIEPTIDDKCDIYRITAITTGTASTTFTVFPALQRNYNNPTSMLLGYINKIYDSAPNNPGILASGSTTIPGNHATSITGTSSTLLADLAHRRPLWIINTSRDLSGIGIGVGKFVREAEFLSIQPESFGITYNRENYLEDFDNASFTFMIGYSITSNASMNSRVIAIINPETDLADSIDNLQSGGRLLFSPKAGSYPNAIKCLNMAGNYYKANAQGVMERWWLEALYGSKTTVDNIDPHIVSFFYKSTQQEVGFFSDSSALEYYSAPDNTSYITELPGLSKIKPRSYYLGASAVTSGRNGGLNLGGWNLPTTCMKGEIYESLSYDVSLPIAHRYLLEQYQSVKWNINVANSQTMSGSTVFTSRYLEKLAATADINLIATSLDTNPKIIIDLKEDTITLPNNKNITITAGHASTATSAPGIIEIQSRGTIVTTRVNISDTTKGNITIQALGTTGTIINKNLLTLSSNQGTITVNATVLQYANLLLLKGVNNNMISINLLYGESLPINVVDSTNYYFVDSNTKSTITGVVGTISASSSDYNIGSANTRAVKDGYNLTLSLSGLSLPQGYYFVEEDPNLIKTLNVLRRQVGVSFSGNSVSKSYDTTATATLNNISILQFSNLVFSDNIALSDLGNYNISYDNANVGSNKDVTLTFTSLISVVGGSIANIGANYYTTNVSFTDGVGEITLATLYIKGLTSDLETIYQTITYGDPAPTIVNSSNYQIYKNTTQFTPSDLTGEIECATNEYDPYAASKKNVGDYNLTLTINLLASGYDFALATNTSAKLRVTAKPLSVTVSSSSTDPLNTIYNNSNVFEYGSSVPIPGAITLDLTNKLSNDASPSLSSVIVTYSLSTKNVLDTIPVPQNSNAAVSFTLSDLNYSVPVTNAYAKISPKPLTVTVTLDPNNSSKSKEYDGTTTFTLASGNSYTFTTASGFIDLNHSSLVQPSIVAGTTAATYNSQNCSTADTITITGLSVINTASGQDFLNQQTVDMSTNYTILNPTITGASITRRNVTISVDNLPSGASWNKQYNGTVDVSLSLRPSYTLNRALGNVSLNINNVTMTYDSPNVSNNRTISFSGFSLDGDNNINHQIDSSTVTVSPVSITAKPVTIALGRTVSKIYDGDTMAILSKNNYTLNNVLANDINEVYLNQLLIENISLGDLPQFSIGTYEDPNVLYDTSTSPPAVVSTINVSVANLSLGGSKAINYVLGADPVSAAIGRIEPRTLQVVFTKVYDGGSTVIASSDCFKLSGFVDPSHENVVEVGFVNSTFISSDSNYQYKARARFTTATGSLDPDVGSDQNVSWEILGLNDAVIGANAPALNTIGLMLKAKGFTDSTIYKNYQLPLNFTLSNITTGNIEPAPVSISVSGGVSINSVSKEYDGTTYYNIANITKNTNPPTSIQLGDFVVSSTTPAEAGSASLSSAAFVDPNVGASKSIILNFNFTNPNYKGTYTLNDCSITTKALTVKLFKEYDATNVKYPVNMIDFKLSGFVNNAHADYIKFYVNNLANENALKAQFTNSSVTGQDTAITWYIMLKANDSVDVFKNIQNQNISGSLIFVGDNPANNVILGNYSLSPSNFAGIAGVITPIIINVSPNQGVTINATDVTKTYDGTANFAIISGSPFTTSNFAAATIGYTLGGSVSALFDTPQVGVNKKLTFTFSLNNSSGTLTTNHLGIYECNLGRIQAKDLTIDLTFSDADHKIIKTYDGNANASIAFNSLMYDDRVRLQGVVGLENVILAIDTSTTKGINYFSSNVADPNNIAAYFKLIAPGGIEDPNYVIKTYTGGSEVDDITQIETASNNTYKYGKNAFNRVIFPGKIVSGGTSIIVSLMGAVSKIYDGNTTAVLSKNNYTLNNVLANDIDEVYLNQLLIENISLGDSAQSSLGTYESSNVLYDTSTSPPAVVSTINVSVANLSLGGSKAINYVLGADPVSAAIGEIQPRTLQVVFTKVYDGGSTVIASSDCFKLSDFVDPSHENLVEVGFVDSTFISTAPNYQYKARARFTTATGSLDPDVGSDQNVSWEILGLNDAVIGANAPALNTIGLMLKAKGFTGSTIYKNYQLPLNFTLSNITTGNIEPAPVSISVSGGVSINSVSKEYDGTTYYNIANITKNTNPPTSIQLGDFVVSSTTPAEAGSASLSSAAFVDPNVGASKSIILNFNFTNPNYKGTYTINDCSITTKALTVKLFKEYDATNVKYPVNMIDFKLSGFVNNAHADYIKFYVNNLANENALKAQFTNSSVTGQDTAITWYIMLKANDSVDVFKNIQNQNISGSLIFVGDNPANNVILGNYSLSPSNFAGIAGVITPTIINVSPNQGVTINATDVTKTYDGTANFAIISGSPFTTSNFAAATIGYTLGGSVSALFDTPQVGVNKKLTFTFSLNNSSGTLTTNHLGIYECNLGRIQAKDLTIDLTFSDADHKIIKTYDGNANASIAFNSLMYDDRVRLQGVVGLENVILAIDTSTTKGINYFSSNVADPNNIAAYFKLIAPGGIEDPNYVIKTYTGGSEVDDITQIETASNNTYKYGKNAFNRVIFPGKIVSGGTSITVSLMGAVSKIYDGNTTAVLSKNNYTLNNVLANDIDEVYLNQLLIENISLGDSAQSSLGTYESSNVLYDTSTSPPAVVSTINVSVANLSLGGSKGINYVLGADPVIAAIGRIEPRTLQVVFTKVYDGGSTVIASSDCFKLSGFVDPSHENLVEVGFVNSTFILGSSDYQYKARARFTTATGSLDPDVGSDQNVSWEILGLNDAVIGANAPVLNTIGLMLKAKGFTGSTIYKNYQLPSNFTLSSITTGNIEPAPVSISVSGGVSINSVSKEYDGTTYYNIANITKNTNPPTSIQLGDFVVSSTTPAEAGSASLSSAAFVDPNVGASKSIILNFNFTNPNYKGTYTINDCSITTKALTVKLFKEYDATNVKYPVNMIDFKLSGFVNNAHADYIKFYVNNLANENALKAQFTNSSVTGQDTAITWYIMLKANDSVDVFKNIQNQNISGSLIFVGDNPANNVILGNYSLSPSNFAGIAGVITPIIINVSPNQSVTINAADVTKTYDGIADFVIGGSSLFITSNFTAGDPGYTLGGIVSALFDTPEVGSNKKLTFTFSLNQHGSLTTNHIGIYEYNLGRIQAKDLTIDLTFSGTDHKIIKSYDGNANASTAFNSLMHDVRVILQGLVRTEDVTLEIDTAMNKGINYTSYNVADPNNITAYFKLTKRGGGLASNYVIQTYSGSGVNDITQIGTALNNTYSYGQNGSNQVIFPGKIVSGTTSITVSLGRTVSKIYDGDTMAILSKNNYTLNNVLANDINEVYLNQLLIENISLGDSAQSSLGTYESSNVLYDTSTSPPAVVSTINVSVANLSLGGSKAINYVLGADPVSAAIGRIEPRTLQVVFTKVYDGGSTVIASSDLFKLSGFVDPSHENVVEVGFVDSTFISTAPNYQYKARARFTTATGSLDPDVGSGKNVSWEILGLNDAVIGANAPALNTIGLMLKAKGFTGSTIYKNYQLPLNFTLSNITTGNIEPAPVSISVSGGVSINSVSKEYDGTTYYNIANITKNTNPPTSIQLGDFVVSSTTPAEAGSASLSSAAFVDPNVGASKSIILNFNFTNPNYKGTYTINDCSITTKALTVKLFKEYDATNVKYPVNMIDFKLSGFVNNAHADYIKFYVNNLANENALKAQFTNSSVTGQDTAITWYIMLKANDSVDVFKNIQNQNISGSLIFVGDNPANNVILGNYSLSPSNFAGIAGVITPIIINVSPNQSVTINAADVTKTYDGIADFVIGGSSLFITSNFTAGDPGYTLGGIVSALFDTPQVGSNKKLTFTFSLNNSDGSPTTNHIGIYESDLGWIQAKDLTITAYTITTNSINYYVTNVYNGNFKFNYGSIPTNISISGWVQSEGNYPKTMQVQYLNKSVGDNKEFNIILQLSQNIVANYNATSLIKNFTGQGQITRKPLTISISPLGSSGLWNKTYNGNNEVSIPMSSSYNLSGVIFGDDVGVSPASNLVANYNDQNANVDPSGNDLIPSSIRTITFSVASGTGTPFSLIGKDSTNYQISSNPTLQAKIFPKPITIDLDFSGTGTNNKIEKTYDGYSNASTVFNAFSSSRVSLNGVVSPESINLQIDNDPNKGINYASSNAADPNNITAYFKLAKDDGGVASNYFIQIYSGALTNITQISSSGNTYSYGQNGSNQVIFPGKIIPTTIIASLTNTITKIYDRNANATLTPNNYTLVGVIMSDISAVHLTQNNNNISSIGVGGSNSTGTYTSVDVTYNAAGIVIGGILVTVSGVSLGGTKASNYTLGSPTISIQGNIGQINPKPIRIAVKTPSNNKITKVYNGSVNVPNAAFSSLINSSDSNNKISLDGIINGDHPVLNASNLSYDSANVGVNRVVTATLTLSGTSSGNYVIETYALGGSYSRFSSNPSGTDYYGITGNQVLFAGEITTKIVHIDVNPNDDVESFDKIYDGTDTFDTLLVNFTFNDLSEIYDDDTIIIDDTNVAANYSNSTVGSARTITFTGLTLINDPGSTINSNYEIASPLIIDNVSILPLTVILNANIPSEGLTKIYDRTVNINQSVYSSFYDEISFDISNLATGDESKVAVEKTSQFTLAFDTADVGNDKGLNIVAGLTLSDISNPTNDVTTNYQISFPCSFSTIPDLSIEYADDLTIVPTSGQSKIYGALDPTTFTYKIYQNVTEVTQDYLPSLTLSRAAGEDVGIYPLTLSPETIANDNDSDLQNRFSSTTVNFTINRAQLTIKANDYTKILSSTNPPPPYEFTISGLQHGDTYASLIDDGLYIDIDTSQVQPLISGEYSWTVTGDPSTNNYTINYVPGKVVIQSIESQINILDGLTPNYSTLDPNLVFGSFNYYGSIFSRFPNNQLQLSGVYANKVTTKFAYSIMYINLSFNISSSNGGVIAEDYTSFLIDYVGSLYKFYQIGMNQVDLLYF